MFKSSEVETKFVEAYKTLSKGMTADEKEGLSAMMQLASSTVAAIHSIAESQAVLAKQARHEMGWKPGDDVTKS